MLLHSCTQEQESPTRQSYLPALVAHQKQQAQRLVSLELNPTNYCKRSSKGQNPPESSIIFLDYTPQEPPARQIHEHLVGTTSRRAKTSTDSLKRGEQEKVEGGKRSSAGTWVQRFLRRRAFACVAKLAGPRGESMVWGARRRRGGRGSRSRGGVRNQRIGSGVVTGPSVQLYPLLYAYPGDSCRQAVEICQPNQ
jgi:hypothetical protein